MTGLDPAASEETRVFANVADRDTEDEAFRRHGIEARIHAGGLHTPDIARNPAQAMIDVNIVGTLRARGMIGSCLPRPRR